jgi:hypothetical protein
MLKLNEAIQEIPADWFQPCAQQGRLEDLAYGTWDAFFFGKGRKNRHKHAVVYLPYGYDESQPYNIFYLMHGGWSDERTYLGTPEQPDLYRNVLDHAMLAGKMSPMIVVCPTYNNDSAKDSSDYELAIELTALYHQELRQDLMPAVEGKYHTYAQEAGTEGFRASRDHRAFGGFSMGSVATWRTFQKCLDEFRYFFPSSGSLTLNGKYMADMVLQAGRKWRDFFIYAMTGSRDFAASSFVEQIRNMAGCPDVFRYGPDEAQHNLYLQIKDGGMHDKQNALTYFFNAMCALWKEDDHHV